MDRLQIGKCLTDILKVGVLDARSTGCIISDIVLWVSLAVILGVVLIRFFLALMFGWCISWKLGSIREETTEERRRRREAVLQWEMNNVEQMHYPRTRSIDSIHDQGHQRGDLRAGSVEFESTELSGSGSSNASSMIRPLPPTPLQMATPRTKRRLFPTTSRFTQPMSPSYQKSRGIVGNSFSRSSGMMNSTSGEGISSPQVPYLHSVEHPAQSTSAADMQAQTQYNFNFDLIHTFMVVTCYSEGEEGLRTTLDSLANTDYPASHKMLLVICDGIITGSGNGMSTPEVVLSMMKDDIQPRNLVKPSSYVAIADGIKRHNMAQVYAGYYKYNEDPDKSPEPRPESEQQKVPMLVIVKCGTEAEVKDKKPGNRGKRDSQVILMNAMQKVYYGDRMCDLEYQFCKAIVKLTGQHPSRFETCLMVTCYGEIGEELMPTGPRWMRQ